MEVGKFGIELECFNVKINTVVLALRAAGLDAHSASYMGREYSVWQVKTDCSIQGVDGFEVVSPILQGEQGIADARKVCEVLINIGAKVNKSCGFHIHHNAKDWKIGQFKNLFKLFAKYEKAMDSIQPESRRANNNRFCQSNVTGSVTATFREIDSATAISHMTRIFHSRYVKLNFQSFVRQGSVEFRNHAGTVDADKVENYIRLTAGMVESARKQIKVHAPVETDSVSDSMKVLLSCMIRSKAITKEIAQFYKARAVSLETA